MTNMRGGVLPGQLEIVLPVVQTSDSDPEHIWRLIQS